MDIEGTASGTSLQWPLAELLSASDFGIWHWSRGQASVALSETAGTLLAPVPDRQTGALPWDFPSIHPDDRSARRKSILEVLTNSTPAEHRFRVKRPDGGIVWLEERCRVLLDPRTRQNTLFGIVWTAHRFPEPDATVAAKAARSEQGERRLRGLMQIGSVGVAFFSNDGQLTDANDTYLGLFGYSHLDLLKGTLRWCDGVDETWQALPARLRAEYAKTGDVQPHERLCRRADGAAWWGFFSARRLGESEGVELVLDITDRVATEGELRESERRLRVLLEGIPQIVWRARRTGHWTWASPQWTELTGQPETHSHALGWLDMLHPEDRARVYQIWCQVSWTESFEADHRLWNVKLGCYRAFKSRAIPVRDERGSIVEWLGTSTDVEDLERLNARERLMTAELQHRTRNLLVVVRSIARQTFGDGGATGRLEAFENRVAALGRAQTLLSAGQVRVDLRQLLETELGAIGPQQRDRVQLEGPPVLLAPNSLQTLALALHELATNALKHGAFSMASGRLAVCWGFDASGHRLLIEWKESGVDLDVSVAKERGFGRRLIEDGLQFNLSASTEMRFEPDGIRCWIELPLAEPAEPQHS